ncbi:glutamine--fructose-6-phosphate transaminase (isomerizing) [archaeon]|nr:MAG: glutamine--fructose-6-phosphate transaminase (isomerizing) [archaeon]RLG65132.1 MAG: glutamine--fructose-6-phosphate transaminase (isomerizing) [archaeon]HDM23726.1 glutamine--fructose-6-phosphate transaminase (isomerizing) [Candidatus Bathyarchaeota archaeon]
MCGIIGIISSNDNRVPKKITEGLNRLTYRGYDSCGVAIISNGKLEIVKDVGTVDKLEKIYKVSEKRSFIGIGHTRWATHGRPTQENAQPHADCDFKIAVAENGIISNCYELDSELEREGHIIRSRCDSEPVAHIVEKYLKKGMSFEESVLKTIPSLKGLFALVLISVHEPDKIIAVRNGNPLMIGIGNGENYVASDLPALLSFTNKYIPLKDGEIAIITSESVTIKDFNGKIVVRKPFITDLTPESAEKGKFETFMLKEIYEQPTVIQNAILLAETKYMDKFVKHILEADKVFMIACGSSYNASLVASYWFNKLAGMCIPAVIASEFNELYGNSVDEDTAIIGVSQSGETQHVVTTVKQAKEKSAKILGVINVLGSQLMYLSDVYLPIGAGPEICVLATKTYMNQLMTLFLASLHTGLESGRIDRSEFSNYLSLARKLPEKLLSTINMSDKIMPKLSGRYYKQQSILVLSHGLNYGTACEGSLKIKEVSYIHSEALPSGELLHGHLALVDDKMLNVFLLTKDDTMEFTLGNMSEVHSRNGKIIAITAGEPVGEEFSSHMVIVPEIDPLLSPFLYVVPLQFFAYHLAKKLGRNIDQPRNLAKTITVT